MKISFSFNGLAFAKSFVYFIVVAAFYKASPDLFLLFKFAASIVIGMSEKIDW